MEVIAQKLDDIVDSLRPLTVEWKDDTARRVIDRLKAFPVKNTYTTEDVKALLDENFDDGILICRLFLGISKDQFVSVLRGIRGDAGIGVKSYRADRAGFIEDVISTGLLEAVAEEANRKPHWSDVLIERLRSGRGSAISGQRRGRDVEDFAEAIVRKVFGKDFQVRCTFKGPRGQDAKCDFAIPSKAAARILIESKGYGATGSKMRIFLATSAPSLPLSGLIRRYCFSRTASHGSSARATCGRSSSFRIAATLPESTRTRWRGSLKKTFAS